MFLRRDTSLAPTLSILYAANQVSHVTELMYRSIYTGTECFKAVGHSTHFDRWIQIECSHPLFFYLQSMAISGNAATVPPRRGRVSSKLQQDATASAAPPSSPLLLPSWPWMPPSQPGLAASSSAHFDSITAASPSLPSLPSPPSNLLAFLEIFSKRTGVREEEKERGREEKKKIEC